MAPSVRSSLLITGGVVCGLVVGCLAASRNRANRSQKAPIETDESESQRIVAEVLDNLKESRSPQELSRVCRMGLALQGHVFDSGLFNNALDTFEVHDVHFKILHVSSDVNTSNAKTISRVIIELQCRHANQIHPLMRDLVKLVQVTPRAEAKLTTLSMSVLNLLGEASNAKAYDAMRNYQQVKDGESRASKATRPAKPAACPFSGQDSSAAGRGCPMGAGSDPRDDGASIMPKAGGKPCYYHEYLQLDKILSAQGMRSGMGDEAPAHDEHLFIVIHQTYELWFKQIIHEIDSCRKIFGSGDVLREQQMLKVLSRMGRVTQIQETLVGQLKVLETMTPMDFLAFRDFLFPASGFQSVQFRLLENKLGLPAASRIKYGKKPYLDALQGEHRDLAEDAQNEASIFQLVEAWLERVPFLATDGWDFWAEFRKSIARMLADDEAMIRANPNLTDDQREKEIIAQVKLGEESFESVLDQATYEASLVAGKRRLSFRAMQAALMILLYRDQPIFQMPFQLLTKLMDIDELLTQWRLGHALMVQRMLGSKMGSGGSSGFNYLKATASYHKIFLDFTHLSGFIIPSRYVPMLPDTFCRQMNFQY